MCFTFFKNKGKKKQGRKKKHGRKKKQGRKKKHGRKKSTRRLDNHNAVDENITESVCLDDSSKYHFVIKDSFGDGKFYAFCSM